MADWVDTQKEINLFTLDSLSNINNKDEFNRKGNERLGDAANLLI